MKNGKTEHDFDSIAEVLRHQNAKLQVLLRHLAHVEATLSVLTVKTIADENLTLAKALKDHTYEEIYGEMIAEVERNLDQS
jgi:hypothetical protein